MGKRDYSSTKRPGLNAERTKKNIDVRKGMVFWFNVHSAIDKFNVPVIRTDGVNYHDTIEYGERPWLVISEDFKNKKGDNVTLVPIHSGRIYDRDPSHVNITYNDSDNTVLCDQPISVNAGRLSFAKRDKDVSGIDMKRVAAGLSYYFGLEEPVNYLKNSDLNRIEDIVNQIIDSSIAKELNKLDIYMEQIIPDIVSKRVQEIYEESQKPSKSKTASKATKKTKTVRKTSKRSVSSKKQDKEVSSDSDIKSKKSYTRWNEESALAFLIDYESLSPKEVKEKYGYATTATVTNTAKRLRDKFGL